MHEKIKLYISEAVEKGFHVETIIQKLVSVGHKRSTVEKIAKEALNERINELTGCEHLNADPINYIQENTEKTKVKIAFEIFLTIFLRMAVGAAMVFTLSSAVLNNVYG